MRKPRVLLVGPWPPTTGGVTTFMLNVANSSLQDRFDIVRFTTSRPPKKNVADNYGYRALLQGGAIRLVTGALVTLWHLLLFPFAVLWRRVDLVQVQSSDFQSFWESSLYVLMARALRRPVLLRLGGAFDHFYEVSSEGARGMIRRVLAMPDRLIVQSGYWRDVVRRVGRSEGILILPNWVPDRLVMDEPRQPRDVPVCLFVAGSEAVRKGVDDIFDVMRLAKASGMRLRFRLVALPPRLVGRLAEEALEDMAEVDGYLGHEELLSAMREADIFLLPSRGEGFPNALVEAMASGLACIATPVGAIPEIVGAGGGIIVPPRDPAALWDALSRLVQDAGQRRDIADRGRAIVKARYIASAVLPLLDGAWTSLLRPAAEHVACPPEPERRPGASP
jgi:glycosyltransferase involved in cell wall biosynthesis